MLGRLKVVYDSLPKQSLRFLRRVPNRWLFGREYVRCYKEVSTSLQDVDRRLYETLFYARENTVFWSKLIPAELKPPDARRLFDDLPFIGPENIANNLDAFVSRQFHSRNSYKTTTGGTGRNPTTIVLSNKSYALEWVHMFYLWNYLGYERSKHLKLTLRGKALKHGKLLEYNPIYNEVVVDTFRMDKSNFPEIFEQTQRCEYLHGYPSLVNEFKDLMDYFGYTRSFRGIFLGSEGAELGDKLALQKFFGCKVLSWYGQSEKVILAADFECNNKYKVLTSYGYPCLYDEMCGSGEIAGTTFINKALPLIKYRTGDYGSIELQNDALYINKIVGRWGKDFVYLSREKKIPTTSINLHGKVQQLILYYQIHQKEFGKLTIKVLPKSNICVSKQELISMIKSEIADKLQKFHIEYIIVDSRDELIKSERGKFILLVQDIPDIKG